MSIGKSNASSPYILRKECHGQICWIAFDSVVRCGVMVKLYGVQGMCGAMYMVWVVCWQVWRWDVCCVCDVVVIYYELVINGVLVV